MTNWPATSWLRSKKTVANCPRLSSPSTIPLQTDQLADGQLSQVPRRDQLSQIEDGGQLSRRQLAQEPSLLSFAQDHCPTNCPTTANGDQLSRSTAANWLTTVKVSVGQLAPLGRRDALPSPLSQRSLDPDTQSRPTGRQLA